MRTPYSGHSTLIISGVVGLVAIVVLLVVLFLNTETHETATVIRTERVSYGSGDETSHKYLVFTDRGTYQCTDSLIFMKFNSSDVYGSLQNNRKYRLHVIGWRVPFFIMYKNIIDSELEV